MRTFKLIRAKDVSGTSGTGIVAMGTVKMSGAVELRFIGPANLADGSKRMIYSTIHYKSLEDCILVHGHGGATKVRMDETGIEFSDLDVLGMEA